MLKGIDPILGGDLLKLLDDMGHADLLLVVDRNFPANSVGRPVVRLAGVGVVDAVRAILSVFPLDEFVDEPIERMEVDGDPALTTPEQDLVLSLARDVHPRPLEWRVIPRLDFYTRARDAFAVVHTLEERPWGCFMLQKGVVFPAV